MARNNTSFDEKVRQYVANNHIQHFRDIDELTGCHCKNTIIHELFPGNDTRKRCFYVKDCVYFLSPQSHADIHTDLNGYKNKQLILNRLHLDLNPDNLKIAQEYIDKLRLIVNTFDIKQARYNWKEFFECGCIGEVPLIEVEL